MKEHMIKNLNPKEKIILMNSIWESLDDKNSSIESPPWHEEVLKERIKSYKDQSTTKISLDELRSK